MPSTKEDTKPKPKTIQILVNGHDVAVDERHTTGLDIKKAAIASGVPIQEDFVLYLKHGHDLEKVDDDDNVKVHKGQEFTCVAPDDVA